MRTTLKIAAGMLAGFAFMTVVAWMVMFGWPSPPASPAAGWTAPAATPAPSCYAEPGPCSPSLLP